MSDDQLNRVAGDNMNVAKKSLTSYQSRRGLGDTNECLTTTESVVGDMNVGVSVLFVDKRWRQFQWRRGRHDCCCCCCCFVDDPSRKADDMNVEWPPPTTKPPSSRPF